MRLITRWAKAVEALAYIKSSSPHFGSAHGEGWRENTITALEALGENPHPDRVEEVWPGSCHVGRCGECGAECEELVEIGQPPDYDSHRLRLRGVPVEGDAADQSMRAQDVATGDRGSARQDALHQHRGGR